MGNIFEIKAPDLGGAEEAPVIDILVSVGDEVEQMRTCLPSKLKKL